MLNLAIVLGPYYPVPPVLNTGVEKMWFYLGQEFARRGCTVTLISRQYPGMPERETLAGVAHRRLPSRDAPASKLLYRGFDAVYAWRALRALPPEAQVVVTNVIWLPVLMRSEANRRRLYVHVARFPKRQMRLYRHAARLQAVSSSVAEAIAAEVPEVRERIVTVPPFISNQPLPTDQAGKLFAPRERTILYLGRIHPEKGVHVLIEAFRRLAPNGWTLEIAGSHEARHGGGGEGYLERLRSLAAGAAVRFSGMVPQTALNQAYQRCAILVYPSLAERGESFGIVPLEAMACGAAVVVSGLACFREYLRPEENGLVFDHRGADPAGPLAAVLHRVVGDEPLRLRIARAGYVTAQSYTLENTATRYLEDFAKVVTRSLPGAA